jgi:hypothetical protein
VAPALLVRGRIERTGHAGRAGRDGHADGAGGAGGVGRDGDADGAGGAVNLVAGMLRPLRVAVSTTRAVASRDFR